MRGRRPVRVVVLDDYEVIVAGTKQMLAAHPDRVVVVEIGRLTAATDVDVVLYDPSTQPHRVTIELGEVLGGSGAKVVVYSWVNDPGLFSRALESGAAGYLLKSCTAEEMLAAIERVADGEVVGPAGPEPEVDPAAGQVTWPGQEQGLSARESDVVSLIVRGLTNQEIADRCFLSVNTIKTYIRTAYSTMGVGRRAEAVRWGIEHGLAPDIARHLHP